jgi:hypothetical protein
MKIHLLKHTAAPSVPDSGSYEVRFPDGRESIYFYWDDNPGRRSITMALSSEKAEPTEAALLALHAIAPVEMN